MPFKIRQLTLLIVAGGLSSGIAGCGSSSPPRVAVSGTVTLDGRPIEQGAIAFVPTADSKQPSAGAEIAAGEYSIPAASGPSAGKYKVEIRWSKPTGKQIELGSPAPPGTLVDEVKEAVPAKYNSKTTLEEVLEPGENAVHFDLTS
jgi:hypothetical protein